jgi:hypothetical protein
VTGLNGISTSASQLHTAAVAAWTFLGGVEGAGPHIASLASELSKLGQAAAFAPAVQAALQPAAAAATDFQGSITTDPATLVAQAGMYAVLSANLTALASSMTVEAQTVENASAALLATSSGGLPWAQLPDWSTLPYCTADVCERVIPRSTDFYRSYGFDVGCEPSCEKRLRLKSLNFFFIAAPLHPVC